MEPIKPVGLQETAVNENGELSEQELGQVAGGSVNHPGGEGEEKMNLLPPPSPGPYLTWFDSLKNGK